MTETFFWHLNVFSITLHTIAQNEKLVSPTRRVDVVCTTCNGERDDDVTNKDLVRSCRAKRLLDMHQSQEIIWGLAIIFLCIGREWSQWSLQLGCQRECFCFICNVQLGVMAMDTFIYDEPIVPQTRRIAHMATKQHLCSMPRDGLSSL